MPDNFFVAAKRMNDSSKVLSDSNQYHNACYLAGYVGECYLKLLVESISTLGPAKKYSHQVSKMYTDIDHAITSGTGIPQFRQYLIDMAVDCPSMQKWKPEIRYEDTSSWSDVAIDAAFQAEKIKCFDKITEMYIDGIIK